MYCEAPRDAIAWRTFDQWHNEDQGWFKRNNPTDWMQLFNIIVFYSTKKSLPQLRQINQHASIEEERRHDLAFKINANIFFHQVKAT